MPQSRRVALLGWLLAAIVTLGFFLLYWNRFAGIRSGLGGFGAGADFLNGFRPYRDYFLAATPLSILTSAAVLNIFGTKIAVTRGLGVFERLVIATLVYAWLCKLFSARHAMIATIVTLIASAGDISDPVSSYNHETIMWAIASGFAASFVLDGSSGTRSYGVAAVASGFLAGLSFATKQTMGLGATIFIPAIVAICLLSLGTLRSAAIFLFRFSAGWLVSAGLLLVWLHSLGILHEFLTDVFLKGPAAKAASPGDFFRRDLLVTQSMWLAAALGLVLLALLWRPLIRSATLHHAAVQNEVRPDSYGSALTIAAFCAIAVAVGATASWAGFAHVLPLSRPIIFLDVFATIGLTAWCLRRLRHHGLSPRQAQLLLYASLSFVTAFMVSLSFPVFEAMLLPGIGLVTAAALDGLEGRRGVLVYGACGLLLLTQTCVKLNTPFGFAGFNEPAVRTATEQSVIPELAGLRLPPGIVDFIDGTAQIVAAHSGPADTIFTYPEMSIFYVITHRRYPTASGSHNIDVVSDNFAREEAKRVMTARPAVLIYSPDSEDFLRAEELLWRSGHRSGQRDIMAAVETLAAGYDLVRTFRLPPDNRVVSVYARR